MVLPSGDERLLSGGTKAWPGGGATARNSRFPNALKVGARLAACLAAALPAPEVDAGTRSVTALVRNGAAQCVIVVPAGKQKILQPAAEELQYHLRKMSGAEIRIA